MPWIKARYPGKCRECGCDISEGEEILYLPADKNPSEVYCRSCGNDLDDELDPEVEV